MARLLLDSTVLIDALRGRPAASRLAALRRTGTEPWACVISVEETPQVDAVTPSQPPGLRRIAEGAIPGERLSARETEP